MHHIKLGSRPFIHSAPARQIWCGFLILLFFLTVHVMAIPSLALCETNNLKPLRIGVLAKRGHENCLKKWKGTAHFLTSRVQGYEFSIVPLDFQEIERAVRQKSVEFLLANPAIYVTLENKYGLSRIATLKNRRLSKIITRFGGVIFCRKNRRDIRRIKDLRGKSFMAVSSTSLGGWYAAWKFLLDHHIDPRHDFSHFSFGQTHDAVVLAVKEGRVDAGTVRTDILERMASEGKISLNDFRIMGAKDLKETGFPFVYTTRLYPEWPFAKLPHVAPRLAEKVAIALLKMEPDDTAALDAKYAGWTIPLSYAPVNECLKALHVGPYKNQARLSLDKVFKKYRLAITVFLSAFSLLFILTFYLKRISTQRKETIEKLKESEKERKRIYTELLHAQKLEAVGELAAGMAHEINTPVQYIGTNIDFLEEACMDIQQVIDSFEGLLREARQDKVNPATLKRIDELLNEIDWKYLKPEVIEALEQSRDGIKKIATIVGAMKSFSGSDTKELEYKNLNEIISNTMEVCRYKWQNQADIETDFDERMGYIACYGEELGQVFLNMILNASDAIREKFGATNKDSHGLIKITTRKEGAYAIVKIQDNGKGIPEDIINRIFDPFFTTKEVGMGAGQGLAICFDVITRKHHGKITVESSPSKGSTFHLYLPMEINQV